MEPEEAILLRKNIKMMVDAGKYVDYTRVLFHTEQQKILKGKNNIWSTFAETGKGKSMTNIANMEIIEYIRDGNWKAEWIKFDEISSLEDMKKCPPMVTRLLDEQTNLYGEGTGMVSGQFQNIEDTVRAEMINFGHASPGLQSHSHHYVFKVYHTVELASPYEFDYNGITWKIPVKGFNLAIVWKPDENHPIDLRDEDMMGYAKFPAPSNMEELVKYVKAKSDFIKMAKSQKQTGMAKKLQEYAEGILKEKDMKYCRTKQDVKTFVKSWLEEHGQALTGALLSDVISKVYMTAAKDPKKYSVPGKR